MKLATETRWPEVPAEVEYLKVEEAAALMRISRAKAYEMAQAGELPGVVRIGRSVRVSRRRLVAWLDGATV